MTPSLAPHPPKRRIVILSGMSGAGLSTALKAFEDLGYEAVDNLRLSLIPALVETQTITRPLAIAADARNVNLAVDELLRIIKELEDRPEFDVHLVFLECADEALERRFTETRRRHPLALDRPVTDGIRREREMLWRLRDQSDLVIDTSLLSIHELRRQVAGHFRIGTAAAGLTLFITSFSFRHGVPREADMVFDVRFLANPHWDINLRPMTGKDEAVMDYIRQDAGYAGFMEQLSALLLPLLPRYQLEGKSYLTIAIGCTGGRHRSVMVAEELTTILAAHDYITGIGHRDLDRAANKA